VPDVIPPAELEQPTQNFFLVPDEIEINVDSLNEAFGSSVSSRFLRESLFDERTFIQTDLWMLSSEYDYRPEWKEQKLPDYIPAHAHNTAGMEYDLDTLLVMAPRKNPNVTKKFLIPFNEYVDGLDRQKNIRIKLPQLIQTENITPTKKNLGDIPYNKDYELDLESVSRPLMPANPADEFCSATKSTSKYFDKIVVKRSTITEALETAGRIGLDLKGSDWEVGEMYDSLASLESNSTGPQILDAMISNKLTVSTEELPKYDIYDDSRKMVLRPKKGTPEWRKIEEQFKAVPSTIYIKVNIQKSGPEKQFESEPVSIPLKLDSGDYKVEGNSNSKLFNIPSLIRLKVDSLNNAFMALPNKEELLRAAGYETKDQGVQWVLGMGYESGSRDLWKDFDIYHDTDDDFTVMAEVQQNSKEQLVEYFEGKNGDEEPKDLVFQLVGDKLVIRPVVGSHLSERVQEAFKPTKASSKVARQLEYNRINCFYHELFLINQYY